MTNAQQLQEALGDLFDPKLGQAENVLSLGRIDPLSGYRNHVVELSLKLRWAIVEFSYGSAEYLHPEFSVQGLVVNTRKRIEDNVDAGGQIQEVIDGHLKDPLWPEIKRLWDLHHLNGMNPECQHMRALGWLPPKGQPATMVEHHGVPTFVGMLRPDEHPEGLLGRKCPECGYAYGSKWLYEPIPEDDLQKIMDLMKQSAAASAAQKETQK